MKRFYSQSTGCTYLEGVNSSSMPSDAVEIDVSRFLTVIAEPAPGKVRCHDEQGLPVLIDPPPATADELVAYERAWRDAVISSTEWSVTRHRDEQYMQLIITLLPEQFAELLQYRQALRDWPQSDLFPAVEHRPTPPAWLESNTP
ncbi:phage tail protein [Pseudomonas brassicae]